MSRSRLDRYCRIDTRVCRTLLWSEIKRSVVGRKAKDPAIEPSKQMRVIGDLNRHQLSSDDHALAEAGSSLQHSQLSQMSL